MPAPIQMKFLLKNKELLDVLSHISHRYAQAKLKNDKLRYFKSGVMFKDSDTDYEHVQLLFSTKRGIDSPHVRKSNYKTYIPFSAQIVEIIFNNVKYTEFQRRIGIELITIDSCEIDIKTGDVILIGDMDSELSMSSFEIGYPLGQPTLIKD